MKHLAPPLAMALALSLFTGCTTDTAGGETGEASGGMGMGGAGDFDGGVTEGAIAAVDDAALDVPGTSGQGGFVTVGRVLAPTDGWVVVRSTSSPGAILGKTWVPAGESANVRVRLDVIDAPQATVSFNIDRGVRKRFEFNPALPIAGIDKPLYVERAPLSTPVAIESFGAEAAPNSALVLAEDQSVTGGVVRVGYVLSPSPTWIVVREFADGLPGRVLGAAWRPAGELQEVDIALDSAPVTEEIIVVLHTDDGAAEQFEFSAKDPLRTPDQPWVSAGVMVSQRIRIAPE